MLGISHSRHYKLCIFLHVNLCSMQSHSAREGQKGDSYLMVIAKYRAKNRTQSIPTHTTWILSAKEIKYKNM